MSLLSQTLARWQTLVWFKNARWRYAAVYLLAYMRISFIVNSYYNISINYDYYCYYYYQRLFIYKLSTTTTIIITTIIIII